MLATKRPSFSRSIIAQYQTLYMRPSLSPYGEEAPATGAEGSANPHLLTTGALRLMAIGPSTTFRAILVSAATKPGAAAKRRDRSGIHVTPDAHELAMPRRAG